MTHVELILDYLAKQPRTKPEVAAALGLTPKQANSALHWLKTRGKVASRFDTSTYPGEWFWSLSGSTCWTPTET